MEIAVHYYPHHIGDFIKATARLTDAQSMSYLRLIWMYYDRERPLPDDIQALAFQLGTDENTVKLILASYFRLDNGSWHHTRCDAELEAYRANQEKKSKAGKASAERRKSISSTDDEQLFNSNSTSVQLTNNQEPVTINQEPKEKTKRVSAPASEPNKTKGTRIPFTECPDDWGEFCRAERPDLDPIKVWASFYDYWIATSGAKGVKADWFATWRNWVRKERQTTTAKQNDSWRAKLASLNTIDMEPSNGQVLSTDIVPF
jgi:uncharacterized protein YdaU (DUF1376 family)